jgi:hypothetical protein
VRVAAEQAKQIEIAHEREDACVLGPKPLGSSNNWEKAVCSVALIPKCVVLHAGETS